VEFDDDLDVFLGDFGVPVTIGDDPTEHQAIVDQPDIDALGGRAQGTDYQLTGRADVFGALDEQTRLVVKSGRCAGSYVIRELPAKLDDGAFVLVSLSREKP
jgi:hypothetical protein